MIDDLVTVRDCFRYAVSAFRKAELSFGHGASDAVDEAAFMVLEALSLPIDDINPWLDARLTRAERERVLSLTDARVLTRKPAAYLLGTAYLGTLAFHVDERVIVPRSYIAELLFSEDSPIDDLPEGARILDLCTGSGCLAIVAALMFPDATVHGVDLSADALEVARMNIARHGVADRVMLHHGDLYAPLGKQRFDLIIANPPYVAAAEMAALPPEYRAEPALALAGGDDGLDIVRRIIDGAARHLAENGGLLCEIGTGAEALEASYPDTPFQWLDTEESRSEVFWLDADDLPKARR